jgi:hypothetical protein
MIFPNICGFQLWPNVWCNHPWIKCWCLLFTIVFAIDSFGNSPLRLLNLHTWTSTWSLILAVPLYRSCFTSTYNYVLSLKGNAQLLLLSTVHFISLDIWALRRLGKTGKGIWLFVLGWIGPNSHPLTLWLDNFNLLNHSPPQYMHYKLGWSFSPNSKRIWIVWVCSNNLW